MKAYGILLRNTRSVTYRVAARRPVILQCSRAVSSPHGGYIPGHRRGYADHVENKILRDLALETKPIDLRPGSIEHEDYPRPTATYLIDDINKLDTDQLLSQFPKISQIWKNKHLKTVVFVVTPGLAHLFEPDHQFHRSALQHILEPVRQEASCTTLVAVVDAVPLYNDTQHQPLPAKPSEGISLLVCYSVATKAESLPDDRPALLEVASTDKDINEDAQPVITLSAPVANTLFVNGRRNTLFTQPWDWDFLAQCWVQSSKRPRQDLSQVTIRAYSSYDPSELEPRGLKVFSYLKPLSTPGAIAKSMGNVVRQITLGDGTTKPASYELELLVPGILKHARDLNPDTDIAIFALVYPPGLQSESDGAYGSHKLDPTWFLRLLARGARLHRVTSGGGGWGAKAGLLAFEPATDFRHDIDEISSMFPGFAVEDNSLQMPATKDIIPEGHVVQFFRMLIHSPKRQAKEAIFMNDRTGQPTLWYQPEANHKYSIGTTVLDAEGGFGSKTGGIKSADGVLASTEESQLHNVVKIPNRFGFLTTSALCLSVDRSPVTAKSDSTSERSSHSTLIEVPNTCFTFNFANGGRNSKRENDVDSDEREMGDGV